MKPESGRSGPPPRQTREKKSPCNSITTGNTRQRNGVAPLGCASNKTRFLEKIPCRYYLIKD